MYNTSNTNQTHDHDFSVSPFKAFKNNHDDQDDPNEDMDIHNNPFTKSLFNRLGSEFDPTNLINKNKKMFMHLNMLDGVVMCDDNENY